MKFVDVNSSTYVDFNKEYKEDPKFEIDNHVRILKLKKKTFLQKVILRICLKKVFWLKMLKCGHMLLMILMVKKLLEQFTKNNCKQTNQEEFKIEKVIKKSDKLDIEWKGYHNLFNSWMDKKYIII